ncbi:MAG: PP2C family protein-serine/threonine phosphatase [Acidobacteriota bacterium]|nr:PP2C family protein-serine/threonine phosphatase [Acidobacteriota bacterium]
MKRREAFLLTVAAGLFLVLLVFAMARLDEARQWHTELDRGAALDRARGLISRLGATAQRWDGRAAARMDPVLQVLTAEGVQLPPDLSPVLVDLRLREPQGVGEVEATFDGTGRLLRYLARSLGRNAGDGVEDELAVILEAMTGETVVPGEGGVAPQAFYQLPVERGQPLQEGGIEVRRWERFRQLPAQAVGDLPRELTEIVEVRLREGRVVSAELQRRAPGLTPALAPTSSGPLYTFLGLAVLTYLVQRRRYRHPHRATLGLGLAVLAWSLWGLALTFDSRALEAASAVRLAAGELLRLSLTVGLPVAIFFGAGRAAARTLLPRRVLGLEELFSGRLSRTAAASLAVGATTGLVLALVPYVAALTLPAGSLVVTAGEATLTAERWPSVAALCPPVSVPWLALVFFLIPLFRALVGESVVARGVAMLAGAAVLAQELPVRFGQLPEAAGTWWARTPQDVSAVPWLLTLPWALALVWSLGVDQLYHRRGLLATLAAGYVLVAAPRVVALLVQPTPLRVAGVLGLGWLLALWVWSLRRSLTGPPPQLEPGDLALQRQLRGQRERIRMQLELAREAQSRMLPPAPPDLQGVEISALCVPAREVGGDLYDFIPNSGRWGLVVGDVSGKGMVASLYMTLTKGLLLAATEHLSRPAEVLAEVNRGLHEASERSVFVTLFYGLLDPASGRLCHVRAGHNPVLWRRAARGETVLLQPPGLPLGATGEAMFSSVLVEEELVMEPGDALVLYTDGVTEAMDEDKRQYDDHRLLAAVSRTDGLSAERARDVLLADVRAFMDESRQHDDLTLVVVRYRGSGEA